MENIKEKTIKEIMEGLETDLISKANDEIDEYVARDHSRVKRSTRGHAYRCIDRALREELEKTIKEAPLYNGEELEIPYHGSGQGNDKNRHIELNYTFKNQECTLAYLSLDVTTKNEYQEVFKVTNIDNISIDCGRGKFDNKTLTEAIEYARELVNAKLTKMREEELPEFIEKTEKRFVEIIESMKKGENLKYTSTFYLQDLEREYDRLRNRY